MLIALMADIHANRQAFEACLAHAASLGAERLVFLGDYVGYGADPEWVVGRVMEIAAAGGVALLGNHDAAVSCQSESMSPVAEVAMKWTRVQLGEDHRSFLASRPIALEEEDRVYVHGSVNAPADWNYVLGASDALLSLKATHQRLVFCGHVHSPALYGVSPTGRSTSFRPVPGVAIPLLPRRRWVAVIGSVGQPRDGNPAASWSLLDTRRRELTYLRVPYDLWAAATRIREVGLPATSADRLETGS